MRGAVPADLAPAEAGAASPGSAGLSPEPPYRGPSLRAIVGLLMVIALLGGLGYTAAVTEFAQAVVPASANGSLLYAPNGTAIASSLIGQNISNASLFWLRPSLTDWQVTSGSGESPFGPTDPALQAAINASIAAYGLGNTSASVPLDLVTPSESGIDPDISEAAALVQVPRIAQATHLTEAFLTEFVEARVVGPVLGFLGPAYVNVIELDIALLHVPGA